jgi:hypothetical protein
MSLTPEVAAYLGALRAELADLDSEERDDLLADVEVSLVESSAEGEGSIEHRHGPPARFAAELRAAAGLEAGPVQSSSDPGLLRRLAEWLRRLDGDERFAAARRTLSELAPIWWLARAYLVAAGAVLVLGLGSWSATHPELPSFGGRASTAIILAALVAVSLALGIRGRRSSAARSPRAAAVVVNLALAALGIVAVADRANDTARGPFPTPYTAAEARALAASAASPPVSVPVPEPIMDPAAPTAGLTYNGALVENIYPFGRDGRPLYDVLLYDQNGVPIDIGEPGADPTRRLLMTAHGSKLFNSFPIRYFEAGTRRVAQPAAGPRKRAPRVATPPLKVPRR